MTTQSDVTLLLKKIGVGVLLVLIPLVVVAGTLHLTHKVLGRHVTRQPNLVSSK
jgi:hypothetical protein